MSGATPTNKQIDALLRTLPPPETEYGYGRNAYNPAFVDALLRQAFRAGWEARGKEQP